ncbi:Protein-L-isoaspartate O-methyltransferase [Methylobacterium crusticola]|uniref:Protein-L-isoaspartate O-methyltransferase n=1 Tax=Methylobacterium crusticola TaxID=1697972 RepID=A0ABQ4QRD5_9HYPH|nr:methyltransferase domain-containing protein [Methylobacterium crusticola]GJD47465.1 Protein-L-isoaspartate O-methyltransferase [Methylobacterium crusticola]
MQTTSTFDDRDLAVVRRAFAIQTLAVAGVADDPRLEDAFASVPRERYLGPPPWRVSGPAGYVALPGTDPVLAYQDRLFALAPERGVNNGSPTLHARWLHHCRLKSGDRVVHLGAGTGYYTALIAHLVGPGGRVTAVECDAGLAGQAGTNLAHLPNVSVVQGDAAQWPRDAVDCVCVNFSVERPAAAWLDRLGDGGRLIFPLGVPRPGRNAGGGRHAMHGAAIHVERRGAGDFPARWLGAAYFVCAEGGEGEMVGSDAEREVLRGAFERGGVEFVRSLRWRRPPSDRSWFMGSGWSLSYDEAA